MSAGSPRPTEGGDATTGVGAPASIVPRPVATRARRQPRWIAAGILALCLGALGSVLLYSTVSTVSQVIRVAADVQRGDVIEEGDLVVVELSPAPGISTVPGSELASLVGRHALVTLKAGALLPQGAVGDQTADPSLAQLGLRLTPGRLPLADLPEGTKVQLIAVAAAGQNSGTADALSGHTYDAVVVTAPRPSADGQATLLDVAVSPSDATEVAALAAADRLVLIKRPER